MVQQNTKSNHYNNEPQDKVIIGKIYSEQCIHCKTLAPEWVLMKKRIGVKNVIFKEIEYKDENKEVSEINDNLLKDSDEKLSIQGGYPTLFSIKDKKVQYYNGERDAESLTEWVKTTLNIPTNKNRFINKYTRGGKTRKVRKNVKRTRRQKGWLSRTICSFFSLARRTL